MKKKQILYLFAASALFAACSSDEIPGNNNEGGEDNGQTVVENLPSSLTVKTEEGIGMSIGSSDTKALTRIGEGEVYFTLEIPQDVLGQWEEYVLEADDFAIRIDGEYKTVTPIEGSNGAKWNKLQISGNKLTVQAEGLQMDLVPHEEVATQPEYTFEVYLWIENQIQKVTENGVTYVERFTYDDKLAWIGLQSGATVDKDTERGYDITNLIAAENGAVLHSTVEPGQAQPPRGYAVRYNVYRGLQGNPTLADGETVDEETGLGNTPYIKVSIHVNQLEEDVPTEVIPVTPKED